MTQRSGQFLKFCDGISYQLFDHFYKSLSTFPKQFHLYDSLPKTLQTYHALNLLWQAIVQYHNKKPKYPDVYHLCSYPQILIVHFHGTQPKHLQVYRFGILLLRGSFHFSKNLSTGPQAYHF